MGQPMPNLTEAKAAAWQSFSEQASVLLSAIDTLTPSELLNLIALANAHGFDRGHEHGFAEGVNRDPAQLATDIAARMSQHTMQTVAKVMGAMGK